MVIWLVRFWKRMFNMARVCCTCGDSCGVGVFFSVITCCLDLFLLMDVLLQRREIK